MKEFKHTTGPWLIKGDEVGYISNHDDQSFGMFCPVAIIASQDCAHLIAAAPELLAALDELANGYAGNGWGVGLVSRLSKARAAIAKALGETT